MNEKNPTPSGDIRTSAQVATDAAVTAESHALELEKKLEIARAAATRARNFSRAAHEAQENGNLEAARELARQALHEMDTAANAASLIL